MGFYFNEDSLTPSTGGSGGGSGGVVDQHYSSTSTNAQSGTAVAEAISTKQNIINNDNKLDYNYLDNTPTIPTVNNATLTIKQNNVNVGTFTANADSDVTLNLTSTTYTAGTGIDITNNAISTNDNVLINVIDKNNNGIRPVVIDGNVSNSSQYYGVCIGIGSTIENGGVAIGGSWGDNDYGAKASTTSVAIGYSAEAGYLGTNNDNCIAIGSYSVAKCDITGGFASFPVAIGHNAEATNIHSIAIGGSSSSTAAKSTAKCAIQIGTGTNSSISYVNSDANTLKIGNDNGNFELLSANGKIPNERLDISNISVSSIENKNTASGSISPLSIWHGTKTQWEQGSPITWYSWRYATQATKSEGTLSSSSTWTKVILCDDTYVTLFANTAAYTTDITNWNYATISSEYEPTNAWVRPAYGNNTILSLKPSSNIQIRSTDKGQTWTYEFNTLTGYKKWTNICFNNNRFIAVGEGAFGYTDDNGNTWTQGTLIDSSFYTKNITVGHNILIANSTSRIAYSLDNGETWTECTLPESFTGLTRVIVGDNSYVITTTTPSGTATNKILYSSNGITWNVSTISANVKMGIPAYGNGMFLLVDANFRIIYSTDGGVTWTRETTIGNPGISENVTFDNNIFVTNTLNKVYYSYDKGKHWTSVNITSNASYNDVLNGKFIIQPYTGTLVAELVINFDKYYTLDQNPTTTSTVYSAPNTESTLTITSVSTGSITLSDTNTYIYNNYDNATTYQSIGEIHPDYICFIDNIGIRVGTTDIITNSRPNS